MGAYQCSTATIWAPLAEIRINERTTRSLSAATVKRYRQWLEQGREAPPVSLALLGDAFVVRDGRHRVAAALTAGHTVIEAEVRRIAGLCQWVMVGARRWRRLLSNSWARAAARRRSSQARIRNTPGDEALTAERLACTEEEWVRLPPSPSDWPP